MREISRAARPLRYAPEAGPYRAGTGRLKRAGAGGPPPERWFLRTASSAFPDRRKGRLRKASLLCIKSCRLRGAAQLWPGSFGGTVYKKARQSVRIAGLFACIRHQNCQPEPVLSCSSAALAGALFLVSGNHRQSQRHENAFSVPGCFPGAEGKCCETEAEENAGLKKAPLRIPKPQRAHEIEEQ